MCMHGGRLACACSLRVLEAYPRRQTRKHTIEWVAAHVSSEIVPTNLVNLLTWWRPRSRHTKFKLDQLNMCIRPKLVVLHQYCSRTDLLRQRKPNPCIHRCKFSVQYGLNGSTRGVLRTYRGQFRVGGRNYEYCTVRYNCLVSRGRV